MGQQRIFFERLILFSMTHYNMRGIMAPSNFIVSSLIMIIFGVLKGFDKFSPKSPKNFEI